MYTNDIQCPLSGSITPIDRKQMYSALWKRIVALSMYSVGSKDQNVNYVNNEGGVPEEIDKQTNFLTPYVCAYALGVIM
jgi:hypothetical protein